MMAILNDAINAYLRLDPASVTRLKKLDKKAIAIEILPFHYSFYCQIAEQQITVTSQTEYPVLATIRGTPLQMTAVMLVKENRHRFFADDIKIEGNAEVAQLIISLFDELQIDWEEYLSHVVGDVPAHKAGRMANTLKGWMKKTKEAFLQNVNDYLHEEKRVCPTKDEVENFYHDVDELRMAVDRAEAILRSLQ